MRSVRAAMRNWTAMCAAFAVVLGALCAGCRSETGVADAADHLSKDDIAFAEGANRPPTAKTMFALARILAAQGRDREAAAALQATLRQDPGFLHAYGDLAELHIRNERLGEAVGVLWAGLKVSPKEPTFINNLGMCFFLQRDYTHALEMFSKAAALAPDDARYRANMAMALGMLGRYHEALAVYRQVLPEPDACFNVGVLVEVNPPPARVEVPSR